MVAAAGLASGIDLMLDLLGFEEAVAGADLVVTGEGSLDTQSLRGKAPVGVASAAARAGVPVVVVSGQRTLTDGQLHAAGISSAHSLLDLEPDVTTCLREPSRLLHELGARIGREQLC